MEERPRVSPSEITRGNRPLEREDTADYRRPADSRPPADKAPDWANESKDVLNPRDIERQIAERRAKKPTYLTGTVTSGGGGIKIPEDMYEVELLRIEEVEIPDKFNEEDPTALKPMWNWIFRILETDRDYKGTVISGMSSQSMHETSKAYRWVGSLMGRSLGSGEKVDLVPLFGTKCRIMVKFNNGGFSTIVDVLKMSPRSAV